MTRDDFLDKQYELSVTAGMNQRYHQSYARFWWYWDFAAKVSTAFLAIAGAMISVGALFPDHNPLIDQWALGVATAAALMAVILNVAPFGGWEKEHLDLFRQWTDLREEAESLLFECPGVPEPHHLYDLQKVDGKLHRLCGLEPSPDKPFLDKCYQEEKKSRQRPNSGAQNTGPAPLTATPTVASAS